VPALDCDPFGLDVEHRRAPGAGERGERDVLAGRVELYGLSCVHVGPAAGRLERATQRRTGRSAAQRSTSRLVRRGRRARPRAARSSSVAEARAAAGVRCTEDGAAGGLCRPHGPGDNAGVRRLSSVTLAG
jgi:hypothetical protein